MIQHAEGKWTGMCGEMAGEAIAAPLLIGLGLDEFSMSATSILSQRKLIRSMKKSEMNELAAKAINCGTMEEVVALVKEAVEIIKHKNRRSNKVNLLFSKYSHLRIY